MKTQGMSQQIEALDRTNGKRYFALFMEQGTGKTWAYLADAERAWIAGKIDGALVIAPRGVHTNWVRREIPTHLEVPHVAMAWRSGMGKAERASFNKLLLPIEKHSPTLRILAINFEALLTTEGYDFAIQFVRYFRSMFFVDESHKIKTPETGRTQAIMRIRPLCVARRIGTGSPITRAPADVFQQAEFLEPNLLGTSSYRAFVAEYADLMPTGEYFDILKRQAANPKSVTAAEYMKLDELSWPMKKRLFANPKLRYAQIPKRNEDGTPRWRNLDRLQSLIEPWSYRVLKKDCLDLPPKIYQTHYFELTPTQRAAYKLMEDDLRIRLEDGTMTPVKALASLVKLQQITSGFVMVPGEPEPLYIAEQQTLATNPRLQALIDKLEDTEGSVIVWARFKEEIAGIARALIEAKISFVEYHGSIKEKAREAAVDAFQAGTIKVFLGQAQAGGTGLTLTAADSAFYYSNDFDHGTRIQSEDRNHRIGTTGHAATVDEGRHVLYIDFAAVDTIDESIARSHQSKAAMAAEILGDRQLDLRDYGIG